MENIKTIICFLCMFVAGGIFVYLTTTRLSPTTVESTPTVEKLAHFSIVIENDTVKIYVNGEEQIYYIPKSKTSDCTVSFYSPKKTKEPFIDCADNSGFSVNFATPQAYH